jgi:hypothetical protein
MKKCRPATSPTVGGESIEAKIAAMLAAGLCDTAIQTLLEFEATKRISGTSSRRRVMMDASAVDPASRQQIREAIRTTRRLMRMDD